MKNVTRSLRSSQQLSNISFAHEHPAIPSHREVEGMPLLDLISILERNGDGVIALDSNWRYTHISRNASHFLGHSQEELLGRNHWECFPELSDSDNAKKMRRTMEQRCETRYEARGHETNSREIRCLPGDNGGVLCLLRAAPIRGSTDTELRQRLAHFERLAMHWEQEREELFAEKERLLLESRERAERDALTGLYDHQAFHRHLEDEGQRALETNIPLSVVVLDIDNFKYFNDVFGHLEGDAVLRKVANILSTYCRRFDTIARVGDDEFALLLPGLNRSRALRFLTRSIMRGLAEGYKPTQYDRELPLTLSIGVASYPEEAATPREALHLADQRLSINKQRQDDESEVLREALTELFQGFPLLDALVIAVDNKDRYTRRHSEDVLFYALMIANEMGWNADRCTQLQVAALLHDVGKIGVPDRILRLPTRLTEAEYRQVQQHASLGGALVAAVIDDPTIIEAVRHHHEAWDGTGYPDRLAGNDIPEMARVLAVADAFSALTTDRPYRRGLSRHSALEVLEAGSGSQWDPRCTEVFLRVFREFKVSPTCNTTSLTEEEEE